MNSCLRVCISGGKRIKWSVFGVLEKKKSLQQSLNNWPNQTHFFTHFYTQNQSISITNRLSTTTTTAALPAASIYYYVLAIYQGWRWWWCGRWLVPTAHIAFHCTHNKQKKNTFVSICPPIDIFLNVFTKPESVSHIPAKLRRSKNMEKFPWKRSEADRYHIYFLFLNRQCHCVQ